MANALQEQLLKAGLASKQKVKNARTQQRRDKKAKVDDGSAALKQQIAEQKGTPTHEGTNSPSRDRSVDVNLGLFEKMKNPIPWITKWTDSKGLQVAPQETEISSYVIGAVKNDLGSDKLSKYNFDK